MKSTRALHGLSNRILGRLAVTPGVFVRSRDLFAAVAPCASKACMRVTIYHLRAEGWQIESSGHSYRLCQPFWRSVDDRQGL